MTVYLSVLFLYVSLYTVPWLPRQDEKPQDRSCSLREQAGAFIVFPSGDGGQFDRACGCDFKRREDLPHHESSTSSPPPPSHTHTPPGYHVAGLRACVGSVCVCVRARICMCAYAYARSCVCGSVYACDIICAMCNVAPHKTSCTPIMVTHHSYLPFLLFDFIFFCRICLVTTLFACSYITSGQLTVRRWPGKAKSMKRSDNDILHTCYIFMAYTPSKEQ